VWCVVVKATSQDAGVRDRAGRPEGDARERADLGQVVPEDRVLWQPALGVLFTER